MHYIIIGFLFAIGMGLAEFIMDILGHLIGDRIRKQIIKIEKKVLKTVGKKKDNKIVVKGFYTE